MDTYDSDLALAQRLQAEELANCSLPPAEWNTYQLSSSSFPIAQPYIPPSHRSSSTNHSRRQSNHIIEYDNSNGNDNVQRGALPYVFSGINRMRSRTQPSNIIQQNVASDITDFTRRSSRLVLLYVLCGIIELISAAVILTLSSDNVCDKPLQTITTIYCSRWFILIPIALYQYSTQQTSIAMLHLKNWTDLASILLWSMMQLWLYSSSNCDSDAPLIYKFDVILVSIEYIRILLPLILTIMLLCSLPFVLLIMRLITPSRSAKLHSIESLKQREYSESDITATLNDSSIDKECSICSEEYRLYDKLTVLPCEHEYHTQCVSQWLAINAVCPLCRHNINEPANKPAASPLTQGELTV